MSPILLNMYNTNYICFVWAWNLVFHIKERKQTEDFREKGAQENIWT